MAHTGRVLPLLLVITACSAQQENGDLRISPAPLFADQRWSITQQAVTPNHERVCTVSSGGIHVTQRAHNDSIIVQVETPSSMGPGSWYAIEVNGHRYESSDNHFDETESQRLIDDFSNGADKAYTEWREFVGVGGSWRWFSNTIPLANFSHEYKACAQYILSSHK